ncbi:MAG: hypothetical protein M3O30_18025, partial [Planctomycetota bacterium]|nr:hypothetical protein [Planctomycetota bacterium]
MYSIAYVNELVLRDSDADGSSSTGTLGSLSGGAASGLDTRLYVQNDANYNVTSLVGLNSDGTSSVVQRYVYSPYGSQTVLSPDGNNLVGVDLYGFLNGFQGARGDPVTGLARMGARDVNVVYDHWMTQDPGGTHYVDGMNLYQA